MDFGKVSPHQLDKIDFQLPPDDPRSWERLEQIDSSSPPVRRLKRFGLGCPVWGVKDWLGKIYPIKTDAKDFLQHYSQQFNTIELNTTHYRIPDAPTIERWKAQTPPTFRFNPKWPQEISHRHPLWLRKPLIQEFVTAILGLESRLGISFLQLPPTFQPDEVADLRRFLRELPRELPIAVEVRHPAFFADHTLIAPLYDLLVEEGTHVVITDVAGRRDVLHTSLSSAKVLVRFIGNDLHPTDETRSRDWVARLRTWIELGIEEVEFFVHQPEDRTAPDLIQKMIPLLNAECGLSLEPWKPQNQGEQLGFF